MGARAARQWPARVIEWMDGDIGRATPERKLICRVQRERTLRAQ
jgi:hypothetical protein